jgi:histidinol-phosphate/aromatic aminotransferase/cobyric acid decarboxylase-like protein
MGSPGGPDFEPEHDVCFHGGAFFEAIGEEFEDLGRRRTVINADVLDAWYPPAPGVIEALSEHLPWLLRTSPPIRSEGLVRTVAHVRGVPAANVLPGAGSSDLIFRAFRTWLTRESRVLLLDPIYAEYAHVCEKVIGCRVDRFPLSREDRYQVDLEEWEARSKAGYDLVVLVNPNNPTGQHVARERLEAVLARLPEHVVCWVDEAYGEYAGVGQSLERFAASMPNVVVCKSLSKVYALSGIRAAYLVGAEARLDELRPLTPPWAVSLPAQVAAVQALKAPAYYAECYRQTHDLRQGLARDIQRLCPTVEVISGVGNFVLCHLPDDGPNAAKVVGRCKRHNLYVRDVGNMGRSLGMHALRVAVKDEETQRRVVEVLARELKAVC